MKVETNPTYEDKCKNYQMKIISKTSSAVWNKQTTLGLGWLLKKKINQKLITDYRRKSTIILVDPDT